MWDERTVLSKQRMVASDPQRAALDETIAATRGCGAAALLAGRLFSLQKVGLKQSFTKL